MLDINKKKIITRLEKLRRRHMEQAKEFNKDLQFLISSIEDSLELELEEELQRQNWIKEKEENNYYNTANKITDKVNKFLDKHGIDIKSFNKYIAVFEDTDFSGEQIVRDYNELIELFQETYYSFEKIKLRIYVNNKFKTLTIKGDD